MNSEAQSGANLQRFILEVVPPDGALVEVEKIVRSLAWIRWKDVLDALQALRFQGKIVLTSQRGEKAVWMCKAPGGSDSIITP